MALDLGEPQFRPLLGRQWPTALEQVAVAVRPFLSWLGSNNLHSERRRYRTVSVLALAGVPDHSLVGMQSAHRA